MAVYQNGIDVSRYQGNINWGRVQQQRRAVC